jgi:hypothetical protein
LAIVRFDGNLGLEFVDGFGLIIIKSSYDKQFDFLNIPSFKQK